MINQELPKIHEAIAYWHRGEVQFVLHGCDFTDDRRGTLTVAQALRLAESLTRAVREAMG